MLQNNAVRDLQYESDLRIAQRTRVDPPIHNEHTAITSVRRQSYGVSQIHVPVSPVQFEDLDAPVPSTLQLFGLDLLNVMPSAHIEQTFELNEALTSVSSENRYTIRSPLGDALFAASESSTEKGRTFWGAARPFQMHILDRNHQETLLFRKKLALGLLCCQPRSLEVWIPPGDFVGSITENRDPFTSEFTIRDGNRNVVYTVISSTPKGCFTPKEATYKILSPDSKLQGTISRRWSNETSQYTLNVYFSGLALNRKAKSLFLGAAFLLVMIILRVCANRRYFKFYF